MSFKCCGTHEEQTPSAPADVRSIIMYLQGQCTTYNYKSVGLQHTVEIHKGAQFFWSMLQTKLIYSDLQPNLNMMQNE